MRSILIIDDEPDVRDSMKRVLGRAGFAVRTLGNPMDVLTELRASPVDLVITDIIMPRVNGVDVIASIAKGFPTVRILAISGGGDFETGSQTGEILTTAYLTAATAAGAHLALAKPFDAAELLEQSNGYSNPVDPN